LNTRVKVSSLGENTTRVLLLNPRLYFLRSGEEDTNFLGVHARVILGCWSALVLDRVFLGFPYLGVWKL